MKFICLIILQLNLFINDINKYINEFRTKPNHESVNISISIRSASTGNEVYGFRSEANQAPASVLKLLTTGTALEYLSGKYKFETMIYSNGIPVNGKLSGDVLLEAIGDPSFGSKRFNHNPFAQVLQALKDNNISTIEGSIKILNNEKPKFPLGWLVGDIGNYYGAFSNNFNYAENLYTVYFNGGNKVGDNAQIANIVPYDPSWKIKNDVKTGEANSGDGVNILNLPFSNDISMVGTVPLNAKNFPVKGAIPNVNQIFTDTLTAYLRQNGIVINKRIFPENLQNEELGSVLSPDVFTIVKETNFESVNLFADGLANFMWESETESYDEFIKNYWKEKGLNLKAHTFLDGSGLAPGNAISTKSMTQFLYLMRHNSEFLQSIPVVGKEGTVASMGKTTGGRIHAKSGSIYGVRNYAGYFTALNGKKYTFSIFTSGFNSEQNRNIRPFIDGFFSKMITIKE